MKKKILLTERIVQRVVHVASLLLLLLLRGVHVDVCHGHEGRVIVVEEEAEGATVAEGHAQVLDLEKGESELGTFLIEYSDTTI